MKRNKFEEKFQKYYPKLRAEGVIKAALFGLACGFGSNLVAAIIVWSIGNNNLWLPIGVGIAVALLAGVISYFLCYKPSINTLARRVDGLGLQERAVTMLELSNDNSCIAALQREDTIHSMEKVSAKNLKIRPSKMVVILVAVLSLLGISATTLVGLAANDVIPDGTEVVSPEEPQYLEVTYIVYDEVGGEIIGETDQLVLPGEDALPVVAVPFDGYVFYQWTDSSKDPSRQETDVTSSRVLHAFFSPIGDGEGEEGEGEPGEQPEEDGDSDENAPDDDQGNQNQEDNSTGESPDDGGNSSADGSEGGGRWDDQNTIIDGTQYYYDTVETYKELAKQFIEANQEIPDYIKVFLETYYDGLS